MYTDLTNQSKIAVFTRSSFRRPEDKIKVYLFPNFSIYFEPSRTPQSISEDKRSTKNQFGPNDFFEFAAQTLFCSICTTNSKGSLHQRIFHISTSFDFQGGHRDFFCRCEHSETIKREPWTSGMTTAINISPARHLRAHQAHQSTPMEQPISL